MGKQKSGRYRRDIDHVGETIDETLERLLHRDGSRSYEAASDDLLIMFGNTITRLDGNPQRLLGMLRRLEATYVSPVELATLGDLAGPRTSP